jgi:soluble lytic murein transglycosylase
MHRIAILTGIIILILLSAIGWLNYHISQYDSLIGQASARNGVDFCLVKALMYEESWFWPDRRGQAGDLGLMQITRAAASDFATRKGFPQFQGDRFIEPELNIEIGCWYLKQSLDRYKNSPQPILFALLRYNAGETRADHWLEKGMSTPRLAGLSIEDHFLAQVDFPKTRAYVQRILKRYKSRNFWF